ncbi:MAG: repeat, subgroup [Chthonomonadaceae bacterium]|nr:repeat, subgroup [Chthonomonadaceae bacterium]
MRAKIRSLLSVASLLYYAFILVALPCHSFAQAVPGSPVDSSSLNPQSDVQDGIAQSLETVAFSPNGALIASAGRDRTVKIWDLQTGTSVSAFSVEVGGRIPLAFSADSKILALSAGEGRVLLLDSSTGKRLQTLGNSYWTSMAFSPDNTTLAIGDADESITLWNYRTGERLHSMRAHVGWIGMLQFSSDGSLLACASEHYRKIAEIWRVRSGELFRTMVTSGDTYSAAFSPDGRTIALGCGRFPNGDHGIELWDIQKEKRRKTLIGHDLQVTSLAYSQDGSTLVAADVSGVIRVWNPITGAVLRKMGDPESMNSVTVSADTRLASICPIYSSAEVFDTTTGALKYVLNARSPTGPQAPTEEQKRRFVSVPEGSQEPNVRLRRAMCMLDTVRDRRSTARGVSEIKQALASGADPNSKNDWGTSVLTCFARAGDLDAVKDLVHRGVKLDLSERNGRTALLSAVNAHHPEIVQFLLDAGADLKDVHGQSLLPLRGHPDALGAALVAALDRPRMFDGVRRTREEEVLQNLWGKFDSDDTALLLLQFGALPNVRDQKGDTAIQHAYTVPVVQALLAHGADINAMSKDTPPPIVTWAKQDQIELVRIALDHGANVNVVREYGTTALTSAVGGGDYDVARLLLERHADPNITFEYGRTLLMTTISQGYLKIVQLLLNSGAKLEAKDNIDGWTALTYAVIHQDREAVRVLLAKGANAQVLTNDGVGLLQILQERANGDPYDITPLLKQAGCVK